MQLSLPEIRCCIGHRDSLKLILIDLKEKKDGYISLKEAAEMSGYASDYIGQLIRKGKLPGKQVYSNVAWVTTEEALRTYMESLQGSKGSRAPAPAPGLSANVRQFFTRLVGELEAMALYKTALYVIMAFSVAFSFLLFFVFAVSLDAWLSRRVAAQHEVDTFAPVGDVAPL